MRTQRIELDGITLDVPASECIKVHTYGINQASPLHAVSVFYYPSLNQVSVNKYAAGVYEYCADDINGNEFHIKTIFIL